MQGGRYDMDELRLALQSNVRAVLVALGYDAKGKRNQLEVARCPGRIHNNRRAMVVSVSKALWKCHVCGTGGDMIDLVAMTHGLDKRSQFGEIVKLAAELVGLAPAAQGPEEERRRADIQRRLAEQKERAAREEAEEAERQRIAQLSAAQLWPQLPPISAEAERYLASRGVPVASLPPGIVRASRYGVVVPLYDPAGTLINVVMRRWPRLGEPKTIGRASCASMGTMCGRIVDIRRGSDVVLCEGVFDTLTALLAWPHAVVLGAHGGENLPKLAPIVARAVREAEGRMFVPAHFDKAGVKMGTAVARAAIDAGLRVDIDLEIVDFGSAKDINEAWQKGWRP